MSIRKFFSWVSDPKNDLSTRCFALTSVMVAFTLSIITIWDIFIGESLMKLLMLIIAVILMYVVVFLCIRYDRAELGGVILSLGVIFFVLPWEFFTGGGVYGCTPIWFSFAFLYVGMNTRGRKRIVLLILLIASAVTCYVTAMVFPDILTVHDKRTAYLDSIASLIGVGVTLFVMMNFLIRMYDRERIVANLQSKEITELNRAQNRFFSSMSHEIRTPINTIIGLNEMILREDISDEVAEDARNIESASKLLLHLINDILDMSKFESGKMELTQTAYNVGDMLSDIVGILWIRAREKKLEFHIDVDPSMPAELFGDEVRIKQVLINVLTNAIKYTSEGSVSLTIQYKKLEGRRVLVTYTISDTGIGIKKENIPYLFTAFKRVDNEKNRYIEGTGLGLSIVKQFVDLMGGEVTVNSVYTKGSTFVISLPQGMAGQEAIGELNIETRHHMNHRQSYRQSFTAPEARLLVVDDNAANLMVVEKLLRDTGIQIETAKSGEEALKKTLETRFDLIFMDHLMPEMDGVECFGKIRTQPGGLCRSTPVTILTANAGSEEKALYEKEGFDGYLLKPVNGHKLESELMRLLPPELIIRPEGDAVLLDEEEYLHNTHRKKRPILITTDSVADLPKDLTENRGIAVIPYHVKTEEGDFLDGVETDTRGLLLYLDDEKKTAHSEPPTVAEYENFFAEQLALSNNVIHISMTSGTSAGYQNALDAAQTFDNVTVVDSQHLSSGLGLMVLKAASMANKFLPVETIVGNLQELRKKVHTSFIVDETEYMTRAGRLNPTVNRVVRSLLLHPALVLKKGELSVGRIYFGSRERVYARYIRDALKMERRVDQKLLFITYTGISVKELNEIERQVQEICPFKQVIFQMASSAISVNCGPGSFGLLFLEE